MGVGVYLVLAFHMMADSDVSRIRRRAAMQDDGQLAILGITIGAALASLGAGIVKLGHDRPEPEWPHLIKLAITITIVLSWAFIHTTFSLHYAHEFYGDLGRRRGRAGLSGRRGDPGLLGLRVLLLRHRHDLTGLRREASPLKQIRRTVAIHGVIDPFLFNTALLALTVNIAASALTPPKT